MPSNLFGAVVVLAALAPGFAYLRAYRRYSLRDARTATAEVVEMFSIGAFSTTVAAVLLLILAQVCPGLLTMKTLLRGEEGLRAAPWTAIGSLAAALLLSAAMCAAAGMFFGRRAPDRVGNVREGSAFVRAVTARSPQDDRRAYLAVELSDGRLVEGYLWYVSTHDDPARRDLALHKPLAWSGTGYTERTRSDASRVIIPGSMIRIIHVSYPSRSSTEVP